MFPDNEEEKTLPEKQSFKNTYASNRNVDKNKDEVRMISQYPKHGSFRFPLIEDEEPRKINVIEKNQKSTTEKEEEKEEEKVVSPHGTSISKKTKEKFQGHHFAVQTIPSPIYGYQPRKNQDKNQSDAWTNKEEAPEKQNIKEQNDDSLKGKDEVYVSDFHKEQKEAVDSSKNVKENIVPFKPKANNNRRTVKRVDEREQTIKKNVQIKTEDTENIEEKQPSRSFRQTVQPIRQIDDNISEWDYKKNDSSVQESSNRSSAYAFPPLHLLNMPTIRSNEDQSWLDEQTKKLNETFDYFHIRAEVVHVTKGPSVTRFEVHPEPGVKVSKIVNLTDDLKLSLAAKDIRIEAPIPGKSTVGIEVPNDVSEPVFLRGILQHPTFKQAKSPLTVAMGMDISGEPVVTDLQKMPHGLIAGSTGSGKSVCVNSILTSIVYKASPEEVRLLLIDPKMVELAPYNDIPHLAAPVITDPKEATEGLKWAVLEMERRYECFAEEGARDISRYNEKMDRSGQTDKRLPYLLIVVDELADLMMVSPQEVEDSICRIAQKARACGIHLLVATQRPSVDVITGLIKANIPTRVAFSVSSQADSRTILDGGGAERLLGKGDMLLLESGRSKPVRIQGTFVSDDEIDRVVDYVKESTFSGFLFEKDELKEQVAVEAEDDLFEEVCEFVLEQQTASASLLQRRFRMGYNRAARLIDDMEARGIVSPARGSKPRDVYLTKQD